MNALKKIQLKLNLHYVLLFLIFFAAILLRIDLAYHSWPLPNSDEGIVGVMAMNILRHGEHPVVFYGQGYLGVLQAYLGALIFGLFGVSVFNLRLGMIILYAAFLFCVYLLTRQLYSKRFALFMTLLLAFGSAAMLSRQLIAIGGYPEFILCAAICLVVTSYLALVPAKGTLRDRIGRHGLFLLWGIAVSIGVWSDSLVLPWVAISMVILLFSWREIIFKGAIVTLLLGILVGGIPLIVFNIGAPAGHSTLATMISQEGHIPFTLTVLTQQIKSTFFISLPIMTGDPVCLKSEFPFLQFWGFSQFWFSQCNRISDLWAIGYIALWISGATMVGLKLKKLLLPWRGHTWTLEERQQIVLASLQGIILLGIIANILPYLRSGRVLDTPGVDARYLLGLWVALPAIVWPLWQGVAHINAERPIAKPFKTWLVLRRAVCFSFLIALVAFSVFGSVLAVRQAPRAHYEQTREQAIVDTLSSKGITHVYADYWFNYRITLTSNERIIGASIDYDNHGSSKLIFVQNRYVPYYTTVTNDPYASYIIPATSNDSYKQTITQRLTNVKYRTFRLDDYLVYQPIHN